MTLIDHARSAFDFAEPRDVAIVRIDAVAVRLAGVGCFGKRIANRGIHLSIFSVAKIRLQPVIVGDAEIHQHVDLAHTSIDRKDWPGGICRGHGLGRGARRRDAYGATELPWSRA